MTRVAWPVVVSMLSYTAMGVTDTLFVGRLGTNELAGTALAATGIILLCSFFMGALRGVKVLSAQATGAGDHDLAIASGSQGLWLALLGGGAVALFGLRADGVAALLGGPADVQVHTATYFGIRCLATPAWFVLIGVGECFQGVGDTRTPMRYTLLANGLNVVLTAAMVSGFGPIPAMGVAGAALATAIAFNVAALGQLWRFQRRYGVIRPVNRELMGKLLAVGAPVGVRWVVDIAGWALMTTMLARLGKAEVAANQVAIRVISVSFLPGYGIGEAACILVGQYVGARDEGSARRAYGSALLLCAVLMGVCAVFFWLAPEVVMGWFTSDPEVIRIGSRLLFWAAVFQLGDAVAMVGMGALNGTGDTRFVMLLSIAGSWLVLVPLGYLFGTLYGMGAEGVWLAVTAEIAVRAVFVTVRWRGGRWRDKVVVAALARGPA